MPLIFVMDQKTLVNHIIELRENYNFIWKTTARGSAMTFFLNSRRACFLEIVMLKDHDVFGKNLKIL